MTRPPTIIDAHGLPPAWQRRFYELIAQRTNATHAIDVALSIGDRALYLRSVAEVQRCNDAMNTILLQHRRGTLHRWGVATLEGLL